MNLKEKVYIFIKNHKKLLTSLLLFVISLTVFMLFSKHKFNPYNNYSYLADAIINGHLDVQNLPKHLESIEFQGHKYMHFAPGCAWISLPFVFFLGIEGFNQIYLVMVLAAINSALAYMILEERNLGRSIKSRVLMALMLTIGTAHCFCASVGDSWFFGHVATLFFILLALLFLFKVKDTTNSKNTLYLLLSGLFFGLAVNCRLTAIIGCIFIGYYIFTIYRFNIKPYIFFAVGAAIFGSIYMMYNYARFGTIMDQGYALTYLKDYHKVEYDILQNSPISEHKALLKQYTKEFGGPLQFVFVKYNLYSLFMMAPTFSWNAPYIIPTQHGVAITFTSPMLFLALTARKRKGYVIALWATTIASSIPFLLNYGNGCAQFGMRYSLDFTPYLWLLMCMGIGRKRLKWWMVCGFFLCYAVNIWGAWYWKTFY